MNIPKKWMRRDHPTDPKIRMFVSDELIIGISNPELNRGYDYHISVSTRTGQERPTDNQIEFILDQLNVSKIKEVSGSPNVRHFMTRDSSALS